MPVEDARLLGMRQNKSYQIGNIADILLWIFEIQRVVIRCLPGVRVNVCRVALPFHHERPPVRDESVPVRDEKSRLHRARAVVRDETVPVRDEKSP